MAVNLGTLQKVSGLQHAEKAGLFNEVIIDAVLLFRAFWPCGVGNGHAKTTVFAD